MRLTWQMRLGLSVTIVLIGASGIAKLIPAVQSTGVMAEYPVFGRLVGSMEIALAIALAAPLLRKYAAAIASVALASGSGYVIVKMFVRNLPSCGCWGGWIHLGPWLHLGINGVLLVLLAFVVRWSTPALRAGA